MTENYRDHKLRDVIKAAMKRERCSMQSLTVLSRDRDPYRLDTPAWHRDAQWFADNWEASGARRPLHLRGIHYAFVSMSPPLIKPNGSRYENNQDDWDFLTEVSNAARWLGYVEFEHVIDEKNDAPVIVDYSSTGAPRVFIMDCSFYVGEFVSRIRPFDDSRLPDVQTDGFYVAQPYRLVLMGEKSSLEHVLGPIAQRYHCELVLPSGDMTQTLLHGVAKRAHEDGRPCRVFYFSDCDMSGYSMPIIGARKLQAFVDSKFPDLDIQMRRCALTPEQAIELDLPTTPTKESDVRSSWWLARFGREQTEVDALAQLQPDVLRDIALDAIAPYFDDTLDDRVREAETEATEATELAIEEATAARAPDIEEINERIEHLNERLAEVDEELQPAVRRLEAEASHLLAQINADAEVSLGEPPELPEPECDGDTDEPLFDSTGDWVEQTRKMLAEKLTNDV